MEKETVLRGVRDLAAQRLVSKKELLEAYQEGIQSSEREAPPRQARLSRILYYVGGGIVFLGVAVFVSQNWNLLNTFGRILVTLGCGIAAYSVGMLFTYQGRLGAAGPAFFLISALLLPAGLMVTFDEAGLNPGTGGMPSLIFSLLFATYLASYVLFRKNVLLLFSVIFGTCFMFLFTDFLVGSDPRFDEWKFLQYRVLGIGLSYMLFGYHFSRADQRVVTGVLYGLGIFGFLSSALALGGWEPNQNVFWELVYPGLVFGAIFLSIYLNSKTFLASGSLFLALYIVKITAEYFADTTGWPVALVLAGFLLMGVGYLAINVKRKYIT